MSQFVLAMDGGGSKSLYALADRAGHVTTSPMGGGVNALDNVAWQDNLVALLQPLRGRTDIVAASMGVPGFGESDSLDVGYRAAVTELAPYPHVVINDVEMAFDGAFLDRPGVLALSGTGAMAVARSANGRRTRAGGWGDGFGDEGSACWIGKRALQLASWAADGRLADAGFAVALADRMGLKSGPPFYGLVDWYAGLDHARGGVARLAMLVDAMARVGNATADGILNEAAREVARQAKAAGHAAGLGTLLDWCPAGSVFSSTIFTEHLQRHMGVAPHKPALPPLGGGLWLAARSCGWTVDQDWLDRIGQSLGAMRQSN